MGSGSVGRESGGRKKKKKYESMREYISEKSSEVKKRGRGRGREGGGGEMGIV